MESHLEKGRIGEEIACRFLEDRACTILERNWRCGHNEVDIIAQEGNELLIVEVKVRRVSAFGRAVEAVNLQKQSHLIQAANAYIKQKACPLSVRYDLIGIDIQADNTYKIEYIPRAFYPMMKGRYPRKRKSYFMR